MVKKWAKFYKMAKCVFSWPAHFKMANLATLLTGLSLLS